MTTRTPSSPLFPCPFCQSTRVFLIGGGQAFVHYRCPDCSEVWTAMSTTNAPLLRTLAGPSVSPTRH
jgi:transposase-like protein